MTSLFSMRSTSVSVKRVGVNSARSVNRSGFRVAVVLIVAGSLSAVACSPDRLVKSDPPSDIVMPSAVTTPEAATAFYNGAASTFASTFGGGDANIQTSGYVRLTAMATDEISINFSDDVASTDLRNTNAIHETQENYDVSALYTNMQTTRINAFQARQALQRYGGAAAAPLVGRMYALEAYTIVMFAEYFCNGIPLSQTSLEGDVVLSPGVTTSDMLAHAVTLFDTAITLTADSANILNMAKVGKGRALLDEGQFAAAATAVADVPVTFAYNVNYRSGATLQNGNRIFNIWNFFTYPYNNGTVPYLVLDHEGGNGLPWSTDPRVPVVNDGGLNYPAKYPSEDSPIRLADGIEAQLIRAEADFQAGGTAWLGLLNDLRANCTSASGCAPVPDITGGTTQLPPLADSLTPVARLREIMQERAYWMYGTGHRQGDLRRMLRPPYSGAPYSFTQSSVYPSGVYNNPKYTGPTAVYGSDVVAMPALAEEKYNPQYHGCFDLNP